MRNKSSHTDLAMIVSVETVATPPDGRDYKRDYWMTTAIVITFIYGAPKNRSVPDSFKVRFSRWMRRRRTLLRLLAARERRLSKRHLVVEEYHNGKVLTRNSCKCWWIWGYRKTQLWRYGENCLRFVHVSWDLLRREENKVFLSIWIFISLSFLMNL